MLFSNCFKSPCFLQLLSVFVSCQNTQREKSGVSNVFAMGYYFRKSAFFDPNTRYFQFVWWPVLSFQIAYYKPPFRPTQPVDGATFEIAHIFLCRRWSKLRMSSPLHSQTPICPSCRFSSIKSQTKTAAIQLLPRNSPSRSTSEDKLMGIMRIFYKSLEENQIYHSITSSYPAAFFCSSTS